MTLYKDRKQWFAMKVGLYLLSPHISVQNLFPVNNLEDFLFCLISQKRETWKPFGLSNAGKLVSIHDQIRSIMIYFWG